MTKPEFGENLKLNSKSKKGTNTRLNSDVQKSKNITIGEETREKLGNLSVIFWQDYFFVENMRIDDTFVEKDKLRNYYDGKTRVEFAHYDTYDSRIHSVKFMSTSKTSGVVTSPWYGYPYDENVFEYVAVYRWFIYFPPPNITSKYPELKERVLEILCVYLFFLSISVIDPPINFR